MNDNRRIRVFISSTFRDMQKERELLVKEVFPELRRVCDERFVSFTEVDLRWGITKEQQAEGKVLPVCLEEIHTCRPYFIGILGERYGWIPNTVPPEVLAKESWIQEHVGQHTSVTELEILHGVLRNPKMAGHAYFYFRDPAYIAKLPANEQAEMVERDIPDDIKEFGPAEAARRTQHRKDRLAALKETVRQSHLPLVDPYANPEALAVVVRLQLLDLIDTLYPKEQVPDPLDQEAIGHRTYARRKLLACIDRPTHLAALDAFAEAPLEGHGLVVTGESGGGKTALLAAWIYRYRQAHPDHFVLEHYFGATSESASAPRFLHRLLGELKRLANITDEIPSDPEKMAEALPLWLAQTVGKVLRIVLVLDALNQIEGEPSHRNLSWLPRFFPDHVRVIASSLPGPALETLHARSWTKHPLPLADADERGRMVDAFLREYRKELGPTLRNGIVNAPGAANPLFLRTVLEELRQFGDFDHLPDKVRDYLQATTSADLFRQVIRRWQADFQAGRNVVDRSLRCLWAARQGLSESEWLDLLADDRGPMDRQTWRPLFLALATHLVQRSGLWALGHDYLKQAIEIELLPSEDARKHAHLAVADYFEKHLSQREMTMRKAAEWPHQLHAAQAWVRLEACLTDIPLFIALCNEKTKWELSGYWHVLRGRDRDMGTCYANSYWHWQKTPANPEQPYVCAQLGEFLSANGLFSAAEPLLRHAQEVFERTLGPEHPDTLKNVNNLGELLSEKGDDVGAESLYRRALEISERVLGPEHHQTLVSLNNLAVLLKSKGDYTGAEPLLRRTKEAFDRIFGPQNPDTLLSMHNLAWLLQGKGDYAGAEPLHRNALEACERVLGPDHPRTLAIVIGLAELLESKGDYAGAEPLYRRAQAARERVLGPEHPDTLKSMDNAADLLDHKGDYAGAEPLYRRALAARERVLGPEHPNTLGSVNSLAILLFHKCDYAGAEPLCRRALKARERLLGPNHPDTLASLNNLALLLTHKGDNLGAESIYRRVLETIERLQGPNHPETLIVVNNLAALLFTKGDYAGAELLYHRAMETRARILGPEHPDTLRSWNNYSATLRKHRHTELAEPIDRKVAATTATVFGDSHPLTIHRRNNLVLTLIMLGKLGEARQILAANWRLNAPPHANTTPRIASLRHIIALLESQPDTPFLGQLKTLLTGPEFPVASGVAVPWDIAYFIEFSKPKLGEHNAEFLTALVAAMNDRTKLLDLDQFPEWRDQPPLPLG